MEQQIKVVPRGWMDTQMKEDLVNGVVGHLPQLTPELFADDIYGAQRLSRQVNHKEVGAISDSSAWDVQYLWWNSETQSNYWAGFIQHAFLTADQQAQKRAQKYVNAVLATQDADGYLGIYDTDLRFQLTGENGELWAQASLLRSLLHYYELTAEADVFTAVKRAVNVTMNHYPIGGGNPFAVIDGFAGVSHGLMFCDVLISLERLTDESRYAEYAIWLYEQYSQAPVSETDIQWPRLLAQTRFAGHGVHTYEHLRVLAYVATKSQKKSHQQALQNYLQQLPSYLTPSGGPIGDEWIYQQVAHATQTGYEYCSLVELFASYRLLFELTNDVQYADASEWLFFNAAQGARHPQHAAIAYLKTDNSYAMEGKAPEHSKGEPDETQTRYQYSPTHQEAAVCCVPNAGRIAPLFLGMQWSAHETGFQLNMYNASEMEAVHSGVPVRFVQHTNYPFSQSVTIEVEVATPVEMTVRLRKPSWAQAVHVQCEASEITELKKWFTVTKQWQTGDRITIDFTYTCQAHRDHQQAVYYSYGPLLYALPIESSERITKQFTNTHFANYQYAPQQKWVPIKLINPQITQIQSGTSWQNPGKMTLQSQTMSWDLIPIGSTILRQTTFDLG